MLWSLYIYVLVHVCVCAYGGQGGRERMNEKICQQINSIYVSLSSQGLGDYFLLYLALFVCYT